MPPLLPAQVLNLSNQGLYMRGHTALIGALPRLTNLCRLKLRNTHLDPAVLPRLALALGSLPSLVQLDVSGNSLERHQAAQILRAHGAPAALVITF